MLHTHSWDAAHAGSVVARAALALPDWLNVSQQERNELEDVGQWACGRPDVGGGLPPIDSDGEDAVFSEELTLEKLQEPGEGPAPPFPGVPRKNP